MTSPIATAIASSYFDPQQSSSTTRHRPSLPLAQDKPASSQQQTDLQSLSDAISSNAELSPHQASALSHIIHAEIDALEEELKGKCSDTKNYYPLNLNFRDFFGYIPLPTVVYELEYPRQERIDWYYVAEKAGATFGVLGVMIVISQTFIWPVVMDTVRMKEEGMSMQDRIKEFPWILSDLLFPFLLEYLMAWYVIWECVVSPLPQIFLPQRHCLLQAHQRMTSSTSSPS